MDSLIAILVAILIIAYLLRKLWKEIIEPLIPWLIGATVLVVIVEAIRFLHIRL